MNHPYIKEVENIKILKGKPDLDEAVRDQIVEELVTVFRHLIRDKSVKKTLKYQLIAKGLQERGVSPNWDMIWEVLMVCKRR